MNPKKPHPDNLDEAAVGSNMMRLRDGAEARLITSPEQQRLSDLNEADKERLVHELRVHQLELEMQNEELRDSQQRLLLSHRALSESRERFFRLFHEAPVGYAALHHNGFVIQANKRLAQMVGRSIERIEGRPFVDLIVPEQQAALRQRYRALYRFPQEKRMELTLLRPDGSRLEVQMEGRKAKVSDEEGDIEGLLLTLTNITELKKMEWQLQAAREQAVEANKAKSNFLSSMSHELRTPLNGILGYTQALLCAGGLDHHQHDWVDNIQRSGQHLLSLINDILDLSKIEQGKMELNPIPFHLQELLDQVRTVLLPQLQDKALDLRFTLLDGMTYQLIGDSMRLGQVLLNLLSNAIKFTSQGQITLRIRQVARDQGRVMLHFEIEDTGIGISMEYQSRLFQNFQQAEVGIARKFGGTGLGLAISKRLVELMGGEIGFSSRPGVGSIFYFTAVFKPHDGLLASTGHEKGRANIQSIDLNGKRVLLVEDNKVNQMVAHALMKGTGVAIDIAGDGIEALARLAKSHYDLILMDVHMPNLDGFETTRRVRADTAIGYIPIIAMTADAMIGDRELCLNAGMDDYLAKPISRELLLNKLDYWLLARKPTDSSAPSIAPDVSSQLGAAAPKTTAVYESIARTGGTADTESNLPLIPRLELAAALWRLDDDLSLLESLLEKFYHNQADAFDRIEQALHSDRPETAELIAHTLAGLAGTIGAIDLQKLARQLVTAIRNRQPPEELNTPLVQAKQEFSEVRSELAHWIEERALLRTRENDATSPCTEERMAPP